MAEVSDREHLDEVKQEYQYGFHDTEKPVFKASRGISHEVVEQISRMKNEPEWMRKFRHDALDIFFSKPMPTWGADLSGIDFDNIFYYLRPSEKAEKSWDDVPEDIKRTFDRLGIPEAERKFLAGVGAQYESEVVYHSLKEEWEKLGVVFLDMDSGLREHEDLVREYFATIIPAADNKFAALNSAVWSGGSFVYVPKGINVDIPLQAYFRINAENFGQFERTLIIADEGSEVVYMEGCTAPKFSTSTLHSAVVELVALKGAKIQYITVQNWANNVFNLVTKRAVAHEDAEVKWIDCNIGSRLTMKYPGVVLKGERARGEVISIALANDGQHQDTGAKMIHAANNTTSNIVAKSISVGQGRSTYRGVVHIPKHLKGCKNNTECDALLINSNSRTDTYPAITIKGDKNSTQHEASVSKVSEELIFYMQQRGLTEAQAMSLSVNGFINDLASQFPMEYSVELKRLIDLEMEGSVG